MKYSEIKVKHIYYADLKPSLEGEFGGTHLCLVISKSDDEKTVNIVSLTSKQNLIFDEGTKYKLSSIINLPIRLSHKNGKQVDSFCIISQIRNVAVSRIQSILNGQNSNGSIKVDCYIDNKEFEDIIYKLSDHYPSKLISNLSNFEENLRKVNIYTIDRLKQIFYDVLVRNADFEVLKDEFFYLHNIATSVNSNFNFLDTLDSKDKKMGLEALYQKIISNEDIAS